MLALNFFSTETANKVKSNVSMHAYYVIFVDPFPFSTS